METFANSMKFVAPVAKSAGMSIEETSAMLAVLANAGIKGSQAGTSLRRIISEIGASGKPTAEALKDLAEHKGSASRMRKMKSVVRHNQPS